MKVIWEKNQLSHHSNSYGYRIEDAEMNVCPHSFVTGPQS